MVITLSAILLGCKLAAEVLLERLNRRAAGAALGSPPPVALEIMGEDGFQRSVAYTRAKADFTVAEAVLGTLILFAVLLSGLLGAWHNLVSGWVGYGPWGQALAFLLTAGALSILSLPLSWWETFRLEGRFGFNKSTPALWWIDRFKGFVLGLLLGTPLLALLFWIVERAPETWWIWGWGVFFGFQLLLIILYPMFILPWFNKLEPLEDGSLRDRLLALANRCSFPAASIQVMDGSRRSAHSNAFFSGFGRFRRIVLFDTLVGQLEPREIEAVLAHEIGHYRRGHILKMLAVFGIGSLLVFHVLYRLTLAPGFVEAFGFVGSEAAGAPLAVAAPAFLLVSLLAGVVTFWISPLFNGLSRKHEYEADAYASDALGEPGPLQSALRKIYRENLGNLVPHPWYSNFHYSHPTLAEREDALSRVK